MESILLVINIVERWDGVGAEAGGSGEGVEALSSTAM